MIFRKGFTALAAAGLVFSSTVAAAAPAAESRSASPVAESEGGIGGLGWILALLIAAGLALVVIDDSDEAASPG